MPRDPNALTRYGPKRSRTTGGPTRTRDPIGARARRRGEPGPSACHRSRCACRDGLPGGIGDQRETALAIVEMGLESRGLVGSQVSAGKLRDVLPVGAVHVVSMRSTSGGQLLPSRVLARADRVLARADEDARNDARRRRQAGPPGASAVGLRKASGSFTSRRRRERLPRGRSSRTRPRADHAAPRLVSARQRLPAGDDTAISAKI